MRKSAPFQKGLPIVTNGPVIIGFCASIYGNKASEQEEILVASGINPMAIYMKGRGAESLFEALRKLNRFSHATLAVAADLRIFGEKRDDILEATASIEAAGHSMQDVRNKALPPSLMIRGALTALSSYDRWTKDKKLVRNQGRLGGEAKRDRQLAMRNARLAADIRERLWRVTRN